MTTPKQIPLLDLKSQHETIREDVLAAAIRVIDSQRFILGEEVEQFEREIAAYCRTGFAVGCASGSDALLLALMALELRPGDEVITVPYTFFATAGSIHHAGGRPRFVDIDPRTFTLDLNRLEDALKPGSRVRAIIPVHLFGACADMDPILELATARGIPVIEDAAQSIGAEYRGRRAGSMGATGCFSFFPSKNLGAYGDAGMVVTNDGDLARRLKALRVHGGAARYYHEWIGVNSRIDALQAAILRVKLRRLDGWTEARGRNADLYRSSLAGIPAVSLPAVAPHTTRHVYNQFVIRADRRDDLRQFLSERGVGTEIYYPLPLHLQQCFAHLGYSRGDFPASEAVAADSLALPIYPELGGADIEAICSSIREFYA